MDKKIIKTLIDEKLEVIQEQFSIIREYQGKIPVIELDLLQVSIRDLYELVISLQMENMGGPVHAKEIPVAEPAEKEPPVVSVSFSRGIISMDPVKEDVIETEALAPEIIEETSPEPEVFSPETPVPEPEAIPEEVTAPEPEDQSEGTKQPAEKPQEKFQRITFDLFSEQAGSTIADRLRAAEDKRIADRLQENKIADLRTTIGINDKFLFINELFEGNMRIYDETVQKLNACTTIAQADLLLLDLKIVYNWDGDSPTVKKFVELVRRKF